MKHCRVYMLAVLVLLPTWAVSGASEVLYAGVAVADITPDAAAFRVPLAGYGARMGRPATGAHDSLQSKVLYLEDGEQRAALVTVDLRSSTPEFKEQVVQKTAELGMTRDNVFIAASHTHAGPAMYPERFWQMQFGVHDPEIVDIMSSAVAEALRAAAKNPVPVRMGIAVGSAEGLTRNRRWEYKREERLADGETPAVDPRLAVIRFDDEAGVCRALIVHFAAHPTILGAGNMQFSAEWPGVLQRELEQEFPNSICLYLNGAQGDQSPVAPEDEDEDQFARMESYGKELALLAAQLARAADTMPKMPIGVARATPDLPPLTFPEAAKDRFAAFKEAAFDGLPRQAELQALRIGPVLLAGLPGEPILEVGHAVEARVVENGIEHTLAVGLANDYIGYILNEKEYGHGGYEVESRSYYGPGLGGFVVDQMAEVAARALGRDAADD